MTHSLIEAHDVWHFRHTDEERSRPSTWSWTLAITAAPWWALSLNLHQNLSDQSSCLQQWSIQGVVCLLGSLCWLADVH